MLQAVELIAGKRLRTLAILVPGVNTGDLPLGAHGAYLRSGDVNVGTRGRWRDGVSDLP